MTVKNLLNDSQILNIFQLFTNIPSITKHFDELPTLLSLLDVNFSVIGITETTELATGGALLYISNHLTYKPRKDLNQNMYKHKELECIFVEIVYEKLKKLCLFI